MKLRPIDTTLPDIAVDASLLYDTRLMPGTKGLVEDLEVLLQRSGMDTNSTTYDDLMQELLILIVKRDTEVFNYAYKVGRQSV